MNSTLLEKKIKGLNSADKSVIAAKRFFINTSEKISIDIIKNATSMHEKNYSAFKGENDGFGYETIIRQDGFFSCISFVIKNKNKTTFPENILLEIPFSSLKLGDKKDLGVLFNSACGCRQSGVRALHADKNDLPVYLQGAFDPAQRKSLFTILYNIKNGKHFFIGFKCPFFFDHNIYTDNSQISILIDIPETCRYDKTIKIEEFLFRTDSEPRNTLKLYSETFPALENVPVVPVGWNSWDFYCNDINLQVIKENIDEISKIPWLKEKIKYIVLDDGWQASIGNWNVNINFKNGMGEVADLIRNKGFIPGIWIAPCKILSTAPVSQLHPDWLAKGVNGKSCVEGNGYTIDPTHPDANSYLRNIFSQLYRDGFRFFKIDYVQDLDACVKFHNGNSALEAQRILMQTIKDAVPDAHILSCGNIEASSGIVQSMRITLDIRTHWEWIKRASQSIAVRYWMHRKLFINDPDFLVIRGDETSNDKVFNRYSNSILINKPLSLFNEKMPVNEARVWATMVLLSGGSIFLSDRIKTLTSKGLSMISTLFELHNGEAAIPVDLFQGTSLPSLWCRKDKERILLAVINWTDVESEFNLSSLEIELGVLPDSIEEKWTGKTFDICRNSKYALKVPPSTL